MTLWFVAFLFCFRCNAESCSSTDTSTRSSGSFVGNESGNESEYSILLYPCLTYKKHTHIHLFLSLYHFVSFSSLFLFFFLFFLCAPIHPLHQTTPAQAVTPLPTIPTLMLLLLLLPLLRRRPLRRLSLKTMFLSLFLVSAHRLVARVVVSIRTSIIVGAPSGHEQPLFRLATAGMSRASSIPHH